MMANKAPVGMVCNLPTHECTECDECQPGIDADGNPTPPKPCSCGGKRFSTHVAIIDAHVPIIMSLAQKGWVFAPGLLSFAQAHTGW